jgi:hypothetical protein
MRWIGYALFVMIITGASVGAGPSPCYAWITVGADDLPQEPLPMRCHPGETAVVVLQNMSGTPHHVVLMNFHPVGGVGDPILVLPTGTLVPRNGYAMMTFQMKPATDFVSPANPKGLPYTTYKYLIRSSDNATGSNPHDKDPELDVPPGSILTGSAGRGRRGGN